MKKIRILIADDHTFVRMGIAAYLETEDDLEVVAEASDGIEAVSAAARLKPDLAIVDLMMPRKDGVAATREILAASPGTKVILLTAFSSADGLAHALEAGASGVVIKNTSSAALVSAIRKVMSGKRAVPADIQRQLKSDPPVPVLTERQKEVLESMTLGLTNKDIAKQLGISEDRIEEHVNALLGKISAANRTEAVAIALRKHLLKI